MNKEILLADLDACTKNFSEVLAKFDSTNFIQKRSDNEWSPAQVAEHLLLLEITALKAINGNTIPTNRAPDEKVALIKWAMEDSTKRVAPESVLPSNRITDPDTAIEKIKQQRAFLREAVNTLDLSEACMLFKHPALGTLTRWEWMYFTIYHMQRHLQQMTGLQANPV
jgi:hypothetical protein